MFTKVLVANGGEIAVQAYLHVLAMASSGVVAGGPAEDLAAAGDLVGPDRAAQDEVEQPGP